MVVSIDHEVTLEMFSFLLVYNVHVVKPTRILTPVF